MAKWKVAVGICGPTILYATCTGETKEEAIRSMIEEEKASESGHWNMMQEIRALYPEVNADSATEQDFISATEKYWQDRYETLLKNADEVVRIKKDPIAIMRDCLGQEIKENAHVAFIRNERGKAPQLLTGTVSAVKGNSIVVNTESNKSYKLMTSTSYRLDNTKILKAVVLSDREAREGDEKDATGYPVRVGDKVVYMGEIYMSACQSFESGKIIEASGTKVLIEADKEAIGGASKLSTRKALNRIVVI